MSKKQLEIYTVGHSNHSLNRFLDLLTQNEVTALADVRSSPFSRHNPHYNKSALADALKQKGIAYVFVGKELGARSDDPSCYVNGQVQYSRIAKTEQFKAGIERVLRGANKYQVALMCAEKEPLDCHRTLLVSSALEEHEASIFHILADGSIETQQHAMSRLLALSGLPQEDMFRSREELVREACMIREKKIAYVDTSSPEL